MDIFIQIIVNIAFSALWGFLIYQLVVGLAPKSAAEQFFQIVPLYPKKKYAILLYTLSGILYTIISYEVFATFETRTLPALMISPFCVISCSQLVRAFAKWRKDNIEESYEEEMERKRRDRFGL